jgi:hypothetical protein
MAQADFSPLPDNLSAAEVLTGVTSGETPPPGGGSFVFGWNSIVAAAGAIGFYTAQANFAPMAKGCSVSAALKRGVSGGPTGFAPFIFAGLQTNSVAAEGYILGLADEDPHAIALVKGSLLNGVPGLAPPQSGVLAVGSETFLNNTWLHVRLDMIVNTNGDVILQMFRNDLTLHAVTAPVWIPLPGANEFVDDALGVNSGSVPFTSGYAGFGYVTQNITRRAFLDQFTCARQL